MSNKNVNLTKSQNNSGKAKTTGSANQIENKLNAISNGVLPIIGATPMDIDSPAPGRNDQNQTTNTNSNPPLHGNVIPTVPPAFPGNQLPRQQSQSPANSPSNSPANSPASSSRRLPRSETKQPANNQSSSSDGKQARAESTEEQPNSREGQPNSRSSSSSSNEGRTTSSSTEGHNKFAMGQRYPLESITMRGESIDPSLFRNPKSLVDYQALCYHLDRIQQSALFLSQLDYKYLPEQKDKTYVAPKEPKPNSATQFIQAGTHIVKQFAVSALDISGQVDNMRVEIKRATHKKFRERVAYANAKSFHDTKKRQQQDKAAVMKQARADELDRLRRLAGDE
jgi:hypothetical protein